FERAESLAQAWGARFIDAGERGHINAESGLADWPEGRNLLHTLLKD
ncbi:MAG: alpha/beta hydrolase, partial [Polaromonas sp.]